MPRPSQPRPSQPRLRRPGSPPATRHTAPPAPMPEPTPADLSRLRGIVGALNVHTTNDGVCDTVARFLDRAAHKYNLAISGTVRAAWYRAALDIHRANRQLYHDAMSGAVG